ncbi:nucleotide sugar transporter SLC35B4 isoform X2 [Hyla sarda]|uniref:nucleotide sugar transporter SLC35B4 isoform X2 n=1 Tax=Hyla sarda TaxID=327740 RepID=UPI0024C47010|nr:nucleotide sugar transporter SLC35B4 isoform X2 [Hyla sarda]
MHPSLAVGLVFSGCCSNVVFLELLARKYPGCGNIVTFAQFLFIAIEGFIFQANFGRKGPTIPLRYYVVMVTMFFTVSVVNNYALNFNISMPLHMIFRSGSLIANMILGIIILKKRYSASKYSSIVLVSMGIFICTLMSAKQVATHATTSDEDGFASFLWWLLGIAALTFALLLSARMGIFQETLYKEYGKHSKEALFYNHALPLPGFLLLAPDIYNHSVMFSQSGSLFTGTDHHFSGTGRFPQPGTELTTWISKLSTGTSININVNHSSCLYWESRCPSCGFILS